MRTTPLITVSHHLWVLLSLPSIYIHSALSSALKSVCNGQALDCNGLLCMLGVETGTASDTADIPPATQVGVSSEPTVQRHTFEQGSGVGGT